MDLLQNPFHILNASPRDNRQRIVELAEERSLLLEASVCMEARSVLTNPRKRISAELAWLPGLGPKRTGELLSLLESSPENLLSVAKLTSMARVNFLAAGLSRLPVNKSDDVAGWILETASAFEEIVPDDLIRIINEERIVSGFPEVTDISFIEAEIQERRRHFLQVIKAALDKLSARELVRVVTLSVETATDDGEEHGPILIADLIDAYEVEAQEFLTKEEGNIKALVEKLKGAADAKRPDSLLAPLVDILIKVVKNWDSVVQPIQVSAKSQGADHEASHRIAKLVRSLAIHMFNEHRKIDFSQQLINMLQEVFVEVGAVAELSAQDADTLDEIAEQDKLSRLLGPISSLCKAAFEISENNPYAAFAEAQRILNDAPQLIANLEALNPGREILSQGKHEITFTLMHCAIVYGNKTRKWKQCITFLEEALKYAGSEEEKSRIQKNIDTAKNNDKFYGGITPISSAPNLFAVNGIGTTLFGVTDYDPVSGSYFSTYCFIFLLIPVFPICRYRVIKTDGGYQFLGKAPLRTIDKWHIAISLGLISIACIFLLIE